MGSRLAKITPRSGAAGVVAAILYAIIAFSAERAISVVQDVVGAVVIGVFTFLVATLLTLAIGGAISRSRA